MRHENGNVRTQLKAHRCEALLGGGAPPRGFGLGPGRPVRGAAEQHNLALRQAHPPAELHPLQPTHCTRTVPTHVQRAAAAGRRLPVQRDSGPRRQLQLQGGLGDKPQEVLSGGLSWEQQVDGGRPVGRAARLLLRSRGSCAPALAYPAQRHGNCALVVLRQAARPPGGHLHR